MKAERPIRNLSRQAGDLSILLGDCNRIRRTPRKEVEIQNPANHAVFDKRHVRGRGCKEQDIGAGRTVVTNINIKNVSADVVRTNLEIRRYLNKNTPCV